MARGERCTTRLEIFHGQDWGAENDFKTAERNFVKTENFKTAGIGVGKLLKIS